MGVARAVLGEEPKPDPCPWVRGCEPELSSYDQAVSRVSICKRQAETWDDWKDLVAAVRRCKRRRLAWLRSKEVAWWDAKARAVATGLRSWFQVSEKEGSMPTWDCPRDVEFADDTVTCSVAFFARPVEQLFDDTLHDWSQRRNVGKMERLLVVPNAPRAQVGFRSFRKRVARKLGPGLRLCDVWVVFSSANGRLDESPR